MEFSSEGDDEHLFNKMMGFAREANVAIRNLISLFVKPDSVASQEYLENPGAIYAEAVQGLVSRALQMGPMIDKVAEERKKKGDEPPEELLKSCRASGVDTSNFSDILWWQIEQSMISNIAPILQLPKGVQDITILLLIAMSAVDDKRRLFNPEINKRISSIANAVAGPLKEIEKYISEHPEMSDEEKSQYVKEKLSAFLETNPLPKEPPKVDEAERMRQMINKIRKDL